LDVYIFGCLYQHMAQYRLASLLVVSLGKALNGIASTFEWFDC